MTIAPVKEEEVYLKPRLVIFYDVISEQETKVVKDFASPRVIDNDNRLYVVRKICLLGT